MKVEKVKMKVKVYFLKKTKKQKFGF